MFCPYILTDIRKMTENEDNILFIYIIFDLSKILILPAMRLCQRVKFKLKNLNITK